MNTEFARTFMAVYEAGTFLRAAERLNVTQSIVSARIRSLEEQLGCLLFERNKGGAAPTPAGQRFRRPAMTLLRTVEQARQDVGIPEGFGAISAVGGRFGLWEQLLLDWLPLMRQALPQCRHPGRNRIRGGSHAAADQGAHRYRGHVHAAEPPRAGRGKASG